MLLVVNKRATEAENGTENNDGGVVRVVGVVGVVVSQERPFFENDEEGAGRLWEKRQSRSDDFPWFKRGNIQGSHSQLTFSAVRRFMFIFF